MSRDFPDILDPWKAADGRRMFRGTMPLKRMGRLVPLLASAEGEARFSARFSYDRQKNLLVNMSVDAELSLICQLSLQPYNEHVRRSSVLMVIRELTEQEMVADDYEPVLVETGRLALVDLVEDELLLGVPMVPRNPAVAELELATDAGVTSASEYKEEPLQQPFAGLAELLKGKAQD